MMSSYLRLQIVGPKKLLIFSVNNVLCYLEHFVIQHENAWVFGRNIDRSKVEVKVEV
jgi:hypothetical protein